MGLNINYTRNYFKNIPVNGYSFQNYLKLGRINPKSNSTQLKFLLSNDLQESGMKFCPDSDSNLLWINQLSAVKIE